MSVYAKYPYILERHKRYIKRCVLAQLSKTDLETLLQFNSRQWPELWKMTEGWRKSLQVRYIVGEKPMQPISQQRIACLHCHDPSNPRRTQTDTAHMCALSRAYTHVVPSVRSRRGTRVQRTTYRGPTCTYLLSPLSYERQNTTNALSFKSALFAPLLAPRYTTI